MHTQPADRHVYKQRECGFCKNAWPKRPGDHKKDCPNPNYQVLDGWDLDLVSGKYRRISQPGKKDHPDVDPLGAQDPPDHDLVHDSSPMQSPSSGTTRDPTLRRYHTILPTPSVKRPRSGQQALLDQFARNERIDTRKLRKARTRQDASVDAKSPVTQLGLPSRIDCSDTSRFQPAPDWLQPLHPLYNNPFAASGYDPHSALRKPTHSFHPDDTFETPPIDPLLVHRYPIPEDVVEYHLPIDPRLYQAPRPDHHNPSSFIPHSSHDQDDQRNPHHPTFALMRRRRTRPQHNPSLPSSPSQAHPNSESVNNASHGPSHIHQPLIDPRLTGTHRNVDSSHHFQPLHSLGRAQTPLTHRQSLRYHDLVIQ
ncbi:hypothetical protein JCM5353_004746 [Sporobolomyces roseus]